MKSACVLFLLFTASCFANAQGAAALNALYLRHTVFLTGGGNLGSTAGTSCSTVGCTAKIPLVATWNVLCEAAAGQTCTFALHADAGVVVSQNDDAFYSATATGAVGPVLNNNTIIYLQLPKDVNGVGHGMASFTFVIRVQNTVANQPHLVEFDLGCHDTDGSGACSVVSTGGANNTAAATLRIDVFTP
jgi:hypothetical protein